MKAASKNTYLSKKVISAIAKKRQTAQTDKSIPEKKNEEESDEEEWQNRSCESVSSDELDGDLDMSDEEEEKAKATRMRAKQEKASRGHEARKFRQEIDTNIFKINFSSLNEKSEIATGDAVFCKECKAAFNMFSQLAAQDQD